MIYQKDKYPPPPPNLRLPAARKSKVLTNQNLGKLRAAVNKAFKSELASVFLSFLNHSRNMNCF